MQRCILVVEDEPLIRMNIVMMLEEAGMTVMDFESADEALDYAQIHPRNVAAIFTDVNLRGRMDGIELASILARTNPEIKILVTSGGFLGRPKHLPTSVEFFAKPWLPLQVITAMQAAASEVDANPSDGDPESAKPRAVSLA